MRAASKFTLSKVAARYWIGIVALGFGLGCGLFFIWQSPPRSSSQLPTSSVQSASSDAPLRNYQWKGGAGDPKYIDLPTIGARGFVQKVGISKSLEIGVPSSIDLAGWFSGSAAPGSRGLSVIDGHVDGKSSPGIFLRLNKLLAGAKFTVELGDGSIKTYEVMSVTEVDTKNALNLLFSQDSAVVSQLNLITCGGPFNTQTRHYEKRVVVATKLVQ